jgi:tetratricopeptide (TPR) repeat protein
MKSNNIFSNPIPRITAYFLGNRIKIIKLRMPENKWETGEKWVEKGLVYYKQGEYDKTIEAFNKAIAIDPNNERAWFGKGQVFAKLGEYTKAIEAFNKAIALDPNNGYAWFGKGQVFAKLGEYNKAIEAFNRAIAINSNDGLALGSKGVVFAINQLKNLIKQYNSISKTDLHGSIKEKFLIN